MVGICILIYFVIGVIVGRIAYNVSLRKQTKENKWTVSKTKAENDAAPCGFFWPFIIPFLIITGIIYVIMYVVDKAFNGIVGCFEKRSTK